MSVHVWMLVVYSAVQIMVGLWIGRRVKTSSDFFVAGRRLGPGLLFATMLAANIGAGSTVGAAGLGYRDGLSAWWWVGSAGLGSLVLAWWVGPAIRREAARHDLRTVGDFLEHRYGRAVRAVIAVLLWIGTLAILAGQLLALAWVLSVVADLPKVAGCLIGGLVMTVYFTAGGLATSARVNLVQLVVLLSGFVVAVPLALAQAGGLAVVIGGTPAGEYWHFWKGGRSGWMYLAMLGPAFVVSPGLLQKIYGARDDRAVRVGVGLNALVLLLFAFLPPLLGAIARARYPELPHHELALPTLLMKDLPVPVGALGLAALFSAEVSSADAILFMLATSLAQDLYRRFVNPGASDERVLAVARIAALAGGTLGVVLAIVAPTVIGVLSIFYTMLSVSLFVPVLAGLFTRRAGMVEACAAIGAGVTGMLAGELASGGRSLGPFTPALVGLMAAAVGFGIVFLVRTRSLYARRRTL